MRLGLAFLGHGLLILQVKMYWYRGQFWLFHRKHYGWRWCRRWLRRTWWVEVIDIGLTALAVWLVQTYTLG